MSTSKALGTQSNNSYYCYKMNVFDGALNNFQFGVTSTLRVVNNNTRFEVLTAAIVQMAVFWVVAPRSLVEVYRRFRGACCLCHQGPDDTLPDTQLKTNPNSPSRADNFYQF
jgi:hypothetical protein